MCARSRVRQLGLQCSVQRDRQEWFLSENLTHGEVSSVVFN